MAKPTRSTRKATSGRGGARRGLNCPECGFRAAHAAGLGRHRSATHGVVSKRQQSLRAQGRKASAADSRLAKRVAALERRYDRLVATLDRFVKQARSAR